VPAGLDVVRELLERGGPRLPLADVRLRPPVPVPAQLRDCLCFEKHLKGAFRVGASSRSPRRRIRRGGRERSRKRGPSTGSRHLVKAAALLQGNRFPPAPAPGRTCPGRGTAKLLRLRVGIGCWIGSTRHGHLPQSRHRTQSSWYSIFNDITARDAQFAEWRQSRPRQGQGLQQGRTWIGPCIGHRRRAGSLQPSP